MFHANGMARMMRVARDRLGESATCQQLQMLMLVAAGSESGVPFQTLLRDGNFGRAYLSKQLQNFSRMTSDKKQGPGWVEIVPDPMNLRTRIATITPKGRRLVDELLNMSA